MSNEPICPCDVLSHPRPTQNPAGLRAIAYRAGDYASFREALLRRLPGEQQLTAWQPSDKGGDLSLQMLEWWAYLADVLTFYNERIANNAYVRTAESREILTRLVALIGYRPRPPLAGFGKVAALTTAGITAPKGLAIQSKPGPGKNPQVFEVDEDTPIAPGGALAVDAAVDTVLDSSSVLVKGVVTSVKPGDELLLAQKSWSNTMSGYVWVTVGAVTQEKDPRGNPNTRITWTEAFGGARFPKGTLAKDCRLLRSTRHALLFQTVSTFTGVMTAIVGAFIVGLASLARDAKLGEWIVVAGKSTEYLLRLTGYSETIWMNDNNQPVLHGVFNCQPGPGTLIFSDSDVSTMRVHYGFTDVGEIIDDYVKWPAGTTFDLDALTDLPAAISVGHEVFIEDVNGHSRRGEITAVSGRRITITCDVTATFTPPIRVLYNMVPVTQGQSVAREVLGGGDATKAEQSFVLQKSPVTYLAGAASGSSLPFRSTVTIQVGGAAWREVDSFVGQPAGAHVFVTREDADGKTHVLFGDGINGARLPTGDNNVVASYRYGAGQDAPDAGALTMLLKAVPGLSAVRNPVAVSAGVDPELPSQLRRVAPLSTFAFGRAISLADYEAIAITAGAKRAQAVYSYDADRQAALVQVYVDRPDAAAQAESALALAVDPSLPFEVKPVKAKDERLAVRVRSEPGFDKELVKAGVRDALLAPESELFGDAARIGATLYRSQIAAACLGVAGVVEVARIDFPPFFIFELCSPGEGGVFNVNDLVIEVQGDSDGIG